MGNELLVDARIADVDGKVENTRCVGIECFCDPIVLVKVPELVRKVGDYENVLVVSLREYLGSGDAGDFLDGNCVG